MIIRLLIEDLLIFFKIIIIVDFIYNKDIILVLSLVLPLIDVPDWFCLSNIDILSLFAIRRYAS
jgi:hypothetical protein